NLVMAALAACASLYIFDITPAECWQWLCNVGGSVHEKGLAVHEQNAARRAERLAARAAEEAEAEEYDGYDDDFPEDEEDYSEEEPEAPAFHIQPPGWLAGV
ncbi:MAG TPA: DNA translocase FtsK, partial [Faecalibacterium sp.]|nr:DNA translocase FtsK [Faecalibacterium sp.]